MSGNVLTPRTYVCTQANDLNGKKSIITICQNFYLQLFKDFAHLTMKFWGIIDKFFVIS